jgi:hypothetical protein
VAIEDFFTTPVTVVNPSAGTDRYNEAAAEAILDYTHPSGTSDEMVWLVQENVTELLDGRDAQVTRWRMFGRAAMPISAVSRVLVDPPEYEMDVSTFEVDGTPNVVSTPAGPHHVEVLLRLVTG